MTKTFNVICIKWGTYYGAEDVNKLCAAIKRNTSYDVNFYCFTERSEGLNEDIISRPLPVLNVAPELVFGNHRKASGLCDDNLADLHGQRVFFFDLDSLIVGNLDELFDYPQGNEVYAINDWAHRRGKKANQVAQASCYSWVVGTLGFIKQYYERHAEEVIRTFGTATQQYMSAMIMQKYGKINRRLLRLTKCTFPATIYFKFEYYFFGGIYHESQHGVFPEGIASLWRSVQTAVPGAESAPNSL